MKKIVGLSLLLFSVFTLGACSNSTGSSSEVTVLKKQISKLESENSDLKKRVASYAIDSATEESSETSSSTSTAKEFNLGESASFSSGEKVTVTDIKSDDSVELYDKKDGEHPVIVTATVENTTSSPIYFNSQTFSLYDGNNEIGSFDASTYDNNIPSEIAGGKKATVVIHFSSKGNAPYSATYGPATWVAK